MVKFPPDVKNEMLGKMASNDLAEISFAGVTARNGFLDSPTTKKQREDHQQRLFRGIPDEPQITLVMVAMEDAPENQQSNNNDLNLQRTIQHILTIRRSDG